MCLEGYDPCQDDIGRINALKTKQLRRSRNRLRPIVYYPSPEPDRKKRKKIKLPSNNSSIPPAIFG